ncbi:glycoside hydrolase family 5 protein [Natronobiforma cellulositropha]|uniref:glycoside hydrolase family 5 protein n=1 Tax=Natronobiforma cellulositropha TaxID=1679076 RepID=UPI0021D5BE48|nr:glycoside hydrolase family 5 protein [Natronobiforma cellulositropha]
MTERDTFHETDVPNGGDGYRPTRRTVLKAVGTGALATGLAAGASSSVSAQGSGPGQDISTPKLSVDGNKLVDPEGNVVKLRGLNIADPRRIDATAPSRGKNAVQTIDYLTDQDEGWYPRVIRIPTQPGDIGGLPPVPVADWQYPEPPSFDEDDLVAYCENHLDPVVERCAERNVYAIIDYHRHWGGGALQWNDPVLDEEVRMYWDYVAERYADEDHVIFEVYNEPTSPQLAGQLVDADGNIHEDWLEWLEVAQPWVDIIREYSDNVILIGSHNYSQRPEAAVLAPFEGENLAYTYHIYPQHQISQHQGWDEYDTALESVVTPDGTPVYEEHPLFVTEFGWEDGNLDTFYLLQGTREEFGDPFLEFLESSDAISWTAWCADPIWRPVMFTRGYLDEDPFDPIDEDAIGDPYSEPVEEHCPDLPCDWELLSADHGEFMGEVIRAHLEEYKDHGIPLAEGGPEPGNGGEELDVTGDGNPAQDLTGDGLYEDVTGDGNLGFNDVVTFFEEHDGDVVQNNVEYFDFSGSGSVGFNDVVALFERL